MRVACFSPHTNVVTITVTGDLLYVSSLLTRTRTISGAQGRNIVFESQQLDLQDLSAVLEPRLLWHEKVSLLLPCQHAC